MGMDMYWVKTPESIQEATRKARDEFYALCNARDEIPKEECGQFSREEINSGAHALLDAVPANATDRYRAAQSAVMEASRAMNRAEKSYFRLNWWGMSRYANAMFALGMAYESENGMTWPKYHNDLPGFEDAVEAVEEGKRHASDDPAAQALYEIARTYVHERDRVRQAHPAGGRVIPAHKFSSNDGWWVTPEEIRAALKSYRAKSAADVHAALAMAGLDSESQREYWDRWIEFLEGAIEQDGFEVH